MKRLALHVLLSLLTFSAGVGIERLWTMKRPALSPTPAIDFQRISPYLFATRPLPSVETTPPVPTASASQELILDYDYEEFDPYGYYTIIGRNPKGFRDFYGFELALYHQVGGRLAGDITLATNENETYVSRPAAYGLVTERRVYFVTAPVSEDEIKYRFDGEFLRGKIVGDAPAGQAVLKGTLTKLKNGRKLAETVIKLQVEVHGC